MQSIFKFEDDLCSAIPQIEAEVEVYSLPDFTGEIIGGVLGGLALLVILTVILYKVNHCRNTLPSTC